MQIFSHIAAHECFDQVLAKCYSLLVYFVSSWQWQSTVAVKETNVHVTGMKVWDIDSKEGSEDSKSWPTYSIIRVTLTIFLVNKYIIWIQLWLHFPLMYKYNYIQHRKGRLPYSGGKERLRATSLGLRLLKESIYRYIPLLLLHLQYSFGSLVLRFLCQLLYWSPRDL